MATISPTQDDALGSLRAFLLAVLPAGVDAVVGVENRVPEPTAPDFAIMTPIRFQRLRTNKRTFQDVRFAGSIASNSVAITASIDPAPRSPAAMPSGIMTVTTVASPIVVGADVGGTGVAPGTFVTGQLSGSPGGIGTYAVNVSQQVLSGSLTATWGAMTVSAVSFGTILAGAALFGTGVAAGSVIRAAAAGGGVGSYVVSPAQTIASETLASGAIVLEQGAQMTVQVDFHSASGTGADMAQTVSTAFRDEFATALFAGINPAISPFYADDPRYAPFQNENQQYEYRWLVEAVMQVNQQVVVPQQFADSVSVVLADVDVLYPPA